MNDWYWRHQFYMVFSMVFFLLMFVAIMVVFGIYHIFGYLTAVPAAFILGYMFGIVFATHNI